MASKFINRNNAFERSNNAHARLMRINYERKDHISSDYHQRVLDKQLKYKVILSKKTRKKIYDKCYKYAWKGDRL